MSIVLMILLASCGQPEAAVVREVNPDHLAKLMQGVELWNQWRLENPEVMPDIRGTDLSQMDLSGYDLTRVILARTNLSTTRLNGADLSSANLRAADLSNADLTNAILNDARYDSRTIWPEGFDPVAAGARNVGQ